MDLENTATGLGSCPYLSLLLSSAVADAVLPIFYIFIPIFAVKLGANALELGLVGGVSYGVYSFMPFVMGHFSDRAGGKKVLHSCLVWTTLCCFFTLFHRCKSY